MYILKKSSGAPFAAPPIVPNLLRIRKISISTSYDPRKPRDIFDEITNRKRNPQSLSDLTRESRHLSPTDDQTVDIGGRSVVLDVAVIPPVTRHPTGADTGSVTQEVPLRNVRGASLETFRQAVRVDIGKIKVVEFGAAEDLVGTVAGTEGLAVVLRAGHACRCRQDRNATVCCATVCRRQSGIVALHVVFGVESISLELADDGVDVAGCISLGDGRIGTVPCRDEAVRFKPADDKIDVRQVTLFQDRFGTGNLALRIRAIGAGDGDEAVLREQVDD